jgi:hypothetical protein
MAVRSFEVLLLFIEKRSNALDVVFWQGVLLELAFDTVVR